MKNLRVRLNVSLAIAVAVFMALASPAVFAQNYSVNINPTLNGLDIKLTHQAERQMLIVRMQNNSDQRARCDFHFNAPPQPPRRSSTFVRPGKSATSTLRASRKWFSVNVDVTCIAVPK